MDTAVGNLFEIEWLPNSGTLKSLIKKEWFLAEQFIGGNQLGNESCYFTVGSKVGA